MWVGLFLSPSKNNALAVGRKGSAVRWRAHVPSRLSPTHGGAARARACSIARPSPTTPAGSPPASSSGSSTVADRLH
jgi:hypothetical protein